MQRAYAILLETGTLDSFLTPLFFSDPRSSMSAYSMGCTSTAATLVRTMSSLALVFVLVCYVVSLLLLCLNPHHPTLLHPVRAILVK